MQCATNNKNITAPTEGDNLQVCSQRSPSCRTSSYELNPCNDLLSYLPRHLLHLHWDILSVHVPYLIDLSSLIYYKIFFKQCVNISKKKKFRKCRCQKVSCR